MVVSEFAQSIRPLLEKFAIDAPDIRIDGMTLDSREVSPHTAFVAVKGHVLDGRDFIPQAISLGAPVIIAQTEDKPEHGYIEMRDRTIIVMFYNLSQTLSSLAGAFFDYPANKLLTTAVTGTNGKTSTVNLITQLKWALGTRSAAVGTLGSAVFDGDLTDWQASPTANTTPDAISMQYQLAEFVQNGVGHVAFEASSHALVQARLAQVKTDIAVFTNLSRDHLDYHGSMENYAAAKQIVLDGPGVKGVVVNFDDEWSQAWIAGAEQRHIPCLLVGLGHYEVHEYAQSYQYCWATNIQFQSSGISFYLQTSWGNANVFTQLLGEFNIYNLLSAIGALLLQGERFGHIAANIEHLKPVAGRMEVFEFASHANVVVDYAHTPDALEKALLAISKHNNAASWCVFGCGGDRDTGKRPLMAKAAAAHSQHIVLTTDNARTESPDAIIADIMTGFSNTEHVVAIPDREEAIRYCLQHAAPNDVILVAGKGHESYQILNNQTIDYDERTVIKRLQTEFSA